MRTLLAIAALAVVVAVFFHSVLVGDRVLLMANPAHYEPWSHYAGPEALGDVSYRTDALFTYLPRQAELSRRIRSGEFPLWTPDIYCGAPFFADPQSRALYPVSLALVLVDPERALGFDVALHFLIAMAGMYLFLRAAGATVAGRIAGALCYGFSSFFFTRMGHPTFVASASYIPWLFYAFERILRGGRAGGPVLVVLLVLGYLSGFPQVFMFGTAALVVYALWTGLDTAVRGGAPGALRPWAVLAVSAALSMLVVAVHLLPFREYMQNSVGLGLSYDAMAGRHIWHPAFLVRALAPGFFGKTADGTSWLPLVKRGVHHQDTGFFVFTGVAGLMLAAGSLAFIRRSRHVRALAVVLALSLGLGMTSVVLKAAYSVLPLVKYSQVDRVSVLACFALAALAGMGMSLAAGAGGGGSKRAFRVIVTVTAVAAAAGAVFFLADGGAVMARLAERASDVAPAEWQWPSTHAAGRWVGGDMPGWLAYEKGQAARALGLAVLSLVLLLLLASGSRRRTGVYVATAGLIILILLDTWSAARAYYVTQAAGIFRETEGISFLKRAMGERGRWRVIGLERPNEVLPPNTNMVFDIPSVGGRSTLFPASYLELIASTSARPAVRGPEDSTLGAAAPADAACGRFVLAPAGDAGTVRADYDLIYDSDMRIYENHGALPKGVLIPASALGAHGPAVGVADMLLRPGLVTAGTCRIEVYEDEYVRMGTEAREACVLVFQDLYYPGWVALVDGAPVPVLKTDAGLRAVSLPAGAHSVEMKYRPRSLTIGLLLTCLGVGLSIIYVVKTKAQKRY